MSTTYEMMFILRPDLNEEQIKQQVRKYFDFLKENGANKVGIKFWGKRHLAYPIKKFQDGIYVLVYYTGDGSQVAPIERAMRLSEEVIRYLTIKLNKDIEFEETEFSEIKLIQAEPLPSIVDEIKLPIIQEEQISEPYTGAEELNEDEIVAAAI